MGPQLHINFLLIPIFVPLVIGGKNFLDHQDFKMALEAMVSKKTIILFIAAIMLMFFIELAYMNH